MRLLKKIVSVLLTLEAAFHFVIPAITLYGMYKADTWDFLILINPVTDIFFGVVCLVASRLLGQDHHHH